MDFSFSPDQEELRDLARRIITDRCTPEHLRAISDTVSGTDLELWRSLAAAGIVGISLPETAGGGGLGWLETAIVLDEVARAAAPVPGLAVMALAGPALETRPDLLRGVADGTSIVAAAIHEPVGDPWTPAARVADSRLTGTKICVGHGLLADRFVVSASGSDGDGLYLVEADLPEVAIERQDTTSGVPDALVEFDGATAEPIGGSDALDDLLRRGMSAAAVMTSAACAGALQLTAGYAVEREQFDRPIAAFQAVSQRVGDAYIDTESVHLTAWHAAWRLDRALPADEALLSAKFWAAEGGWRVIHAAQHVHGGVGVDRDYPLFRYFLMHKQLELLLSSATPTLQRLGRTLADQPRQARPGRQPVAPSNSLASAADRL
ncbi:MAG: acyl-CoA dehydrogenase family protein [Acidimicrobiia bacterium]|nr:acyl-CoA dehydrogenase family protein [Acidimicrobiia bacterium]